MSDRVILTSENTEATASWSIGQVAWFDETGSTTFLCIELNGRYHILLESQAWEMLESLEGVLGSDRPNA